MFDFYLTMLISAQKNNVNFTSTPLNFVNLKKMENGVQKGFVKAVYSKLDPKDPEDIASIVKLQYTCKDGILNDFCRKFLHSPSVLEEYNAIEVIGNKQLGGKIVGLSNTSSNISFDKKIVSLLDLITLPSFSKKNENRTLSGIGENMFAAAFYKAGKTKAQRLDLTASREASPFYVKTLQKAGIIDPADSDTYEMTHGRFNFDKKYFDQYLAYCKKEYGTDFSKRINDGIKF